jgi:molybdate transport system permease protein
MSSLDFAPFILSFKLAFITTIILFVICVPFAWYLSQTTSKSKPWIEALSSLPIVLPPSVLGFYILVTLVPNSALGGFLSDYFGVKLLFSFSGLVVASCFYSLPFMLQPLQSGFESLNKIC